jgi:ATP-dependent RNA helicase SUPV3L1/SUV3
LVQACVTQYNKTNILDFHLLKETLSDERVRLIKANELSEQDLDYVREESDAQTILSFLQTIHEGLNEFFSNYPSLTQIFNKEFIHLSEFYSHDYVIDIIFLDDCLIPDKEMFIFGQDGLINLSILNVHLDYFKDWMNEKKEKHDKTQEELQNSFSLEIKTESLDCSCHDCHSFFKTRFREYLLESCYSDIDATIEIIKKDIKFKTITETSYLFTDLQKGLEKKLHKVKHRFKKSAFNRLESQIRTRMRELFTHPSELSKIQESRLIPYFKEILLSMELREDFLDEEDYKRFFNQQSENIWRSEKYLKREFKKIVKAFMLLKRKDISGKILQDYIGEFWTHSVVRTVKRKIIYHMGPTNSGKTYHAIERLAAVERGCYLAPLRLLAAELYDTLNTKGVVTNLLTGEEVVEKENATHYSSTIEMARLTDPIDCCVIDEIQMIADAQRGWAWTRAFVNIYAAEVHLCGDPSVRSLIEQIVELCGDELEIREYERMTELKVEEKPISLGEMQKSDALIVFSRRNALRYKRDLEKLDFKVSIVYGRLSPEVRREQARKFDHQETDIIVATDAISMGMNLPIKRIIFSTLAKYYDSKEHEITEGEIKQIAGRAGRYQRFPTGYVNCLAKVEDGLDIVEGALSMNLEQQARCMVGPDLDIFTQVNQALSDHGLELLKLSEFLRLFNTMHFQKPFFCVELKEMIELAEMVEEADAEGNLTQSEVFGFTCAPVNLGLVDHVQYYRDLMHGYVASLSMVNEPIDSRASDIDYLETTIKCVELYQWLARHFNGKNFDFNEEELLSNKMDAVERLNTLLSKKIVPTCSSCGAKLADTSEFNICEVCFKKRRFGYKRSKKPEQGKSDDGKSGRDGKKKARGSFQSRGKKKVGSRKKKRGVTR